MTRLIIHEDDSFLVLDGILKLLGILCRCLVSYDLGDPFCIIAFIFKTLFAFVGIIMMIIVGGAPD